MESKAFLKMELITLTDILKLLAALGFVIGLMGLLAFGLKKLGLAQGMPTGGPSRRLKIIESLPLDPRRRAVILRCDEKDHLVILGPGGETVVGTEMKAPKDTK
jgi:flagellar protein FliO/FliZ